MIKAETFWDGIATRYAARPIGDMAAYEATLERVAAYLEPGFRVIEHGAGTGTTAIRLRPLVADYVAADISGALLNVAYERATEARVPPIELRKAAMEDDVEPESRDVVMAFNLLHLADDPSLAMRRMAGAIRPGGLFISKTPCLAQGARLLRPVIWVLQRLGRAPKVHFLEAAELERIVEGAGLSIVETGWYPRKTAARFIVARKG